MNPGTLAEKIIGLPNYLRRLQWPAVERLLDVSGGQVVLDLGAGSLQYSRRISGVDGVYLIAMDLAFRDDHLSRVHRGNLSPVRGNGQSLPLADGSVDRILMSSLLQMVPSPERLLRECRRVLKPGGCIVLSVPNWYVFIPRWMRCSFFGSPAFRIVNLPVKYETLLLQLNTKFGVQGPTGYYSHEELVNLIEGAGFAIKDHEFSPGGCGSFFWELGVLGYLKLGNLAFHLLMLCYPVAKLSDMLFMARTGSEHIVRIVPVYEK